VYLEPAAERLPLASAVGETGELPVGFDDQHVHVAELAEQVDSRAVVTDRYGDESVVGVVARHVGHLDAAHRLGMQLQHKRHRLSAVVRMDRFGHGIDLPGVGVQAPGPCQRRPGHSVVDDRSVRPGDDAITAPSPFAPVLVGHRSEQRTLGSTRRISNLAALSELARAWMAGSLGEVGAAVLGEEGVGPLAPRPTVLAGVSGSEWGEHVIHRAIVRAQEDDADLLVVHVNVADGLGRRVADALDRYRDMTIDAGGDYAEVDGTSVADTLAAVARERHATRIVVARHRSRLNELVRGSVASRIRSLVRGTPVDEVHRQR
jgi:nucleotide-binding universal stress UspA family protein